MSDITEHPDPAERIPMGEVIDHLRRIGIPTTIAAANFLASAVGDRPFAAQVTTEEAEGASVVSHNPDTEDRKGVYYVWGTWDAVDALSDERHRRALLIESQAAEITRLREQNQALTERTTPPDDVRITTAGLQQIVDRTRDMGGADLPLYVARLIEHAYLSASPNAETTETQPDTKVCDRCKVGMHTQCQGDFTKLCGCTCCAASPWAPTDGA